MMGEMYIHEAVTLLVKIQQCEYKQCDADFQRNWRILELQKFDKMTKKKNSNSKNLMNPTDREAYDDK